MTWEGLTPPYRTIVADPPWQPRQVKSSKACPSKHYSTMTLEAVEALPVVDLLAPDAHLWLWVTNSWIADVGKLIRLWGFDPVTVVTWCKPGPGVGWYVRNNTEHVVFATRGRPMTPEVKPLSSWYEWARPSGHSAKPAAFADLVEQVSPGPYVELFARAPRLGWDSWGHGYEVAS